MAHSPGELDEADGGAVDVLRWMRMAHASLRSTRRLRRPGARWQNVVDMRWRLTPYRAQPVRVDAEGGVGLELYVTFKPSWM